MLKFMQASHFFFFIYSINFWKCLFIWMEFLFSVCIFECITLKYGWFLFEMIQWSQTHEKTVKTTTVTMTRWRWKPEQLTIIQLKFIRVAHLHWNQDTFSHKQQKDWFLRFIHSSKCPSNPPLTKTKSSKTWKKGVKMNRHAEHVEKQMHMKLLKKEISAILTISYIHKFSVLLTQSYSLSGIREEKKKTQKMFTWSLTDVIAFYDLCKLPHVGTMHDYVKSFSFISSLIFSFLCVLVCFFVRKSEWVNESRRGKAVIEKPCHVKKLNREPFCLHSKCHMKKYICVSLLWLSFFEHSFYLFHIMDSFGINRCVLCLFVYKSVSSTTKRNVHTKNNGCEFIYIQW